jgi:acetyl-CoA acetyltransferase
VAAAQTRYEKKPTRPPMAFLVEAFELVLKAAGARPREIDGLAVTSYQLGPDNVTTVAEHLGLELRWSWQGAMGGAAPVISVAEAARAIDQGLAETVVCVAGDSFDVQSHMEMLDRDFNGAMRDYLAPYGFGGTNGLFALVQTRHMHDFGSTREQFGALAVAQRENARSNPNALLREPLTLEDYLNARPIAEPLGLFDCVLPCGGADAVLVTAAGSPISERSTRCPVEVLSSGALHNWDAGNPVTLSGGWSSYIGGLLGAAGLDRGDVQMLQLYDDYPVMVAIQVESLGFCGRGEGARFLAETDTTREGPLPINTGGGQLSCGQAGAAGGMIGVVEAVWQLQGIAGERQLERHDNALVSGFGMVGYGRGLSSSALVLGA